MKISINSKDETLYNGFIYKKVPLTSIEKADVVFIDWLDSSFMKYFDSLSRLKKKCIIFDRNLSISPSESHILRQKGAVLCEPALNFRRKFFHYLPYWVKVKDMEDIELNETDRPYDLVFKGSIQDKIQSFNKYYIPYSNEYPNTVTVSDKVYTNRGVIKNDFTFSECKATVIIGSQDDYEIGYIDYNFIDALNNNCVPLVVPENRYFSSLAPYVIGSPFDINYIVANYESSYIGWLLGIYKHIKDFYPEMILENVVQQIIDLA